MTRFVILIFVVVCFFTSGTLVQAQYSPLPRQCTDAYLEWYYFMVGQITIGKPYVPRMPEKLWFAQAMAAQRLAPAQMEMMWNMPVFWATFQMGWSNLSEWQRDAARRSWRLQIAGGRSLRDSARVRSRNFKQFTVLYWNVRVRGDTSARKSSRYERPTPKLFDQHV
jgi:hypothetical protein